MLEIAEAERLHWDEGLTPRQVAARMGTTQARAYTLLHASTRGLRKLTPGTQPQPAARPDVTPELVAKMYLEQGMTQPQIAAELHCAPSTVNKRLQQFRAGSAVPLGSTQDDGEGNGDDVRAGQGRERAGPSGAR